LPVIKSTTLDTIAVMGLAGVVELLATAETSSTVAAAIRGEDRTAAATVVLAVCADPALVAPAAPTAAVWVGESDPADDAVVLADTDDIAAELSNVGEWAAADCFLLVDVLDAAPVPPAEEVVEAPVDPVVDAAEEPVVDPLTPVAVEVGPLSLAPAEPVSTVPAPDDDVDAAPVPATPVIPVEELPVASDVPVEDAPVVPVVPVAPVEEGPPDTLVLAPPEALTAPDRLLPVDDLPGVDEDNE
jgi:hypothetical protein